MHGLRHVAVLLAIVLLGACSSSPEVAPNQKAAAPGATSQRQDAAVSSLEAQSRQAQAEPTPLIAVSGDIVCDPVDDPNYNGGAGIGRRCRHRATSDQLLATNFTAVLTVGDNQYQTGTLEDYRAAYHPTWGRVKSKTYPSPGNHEYYTRGATGYYGYFGSRVRGPDGRGYYSFNLGNWHLVALNTNCHILRCDKDSPQAAWLRADLAASDADCTLVYGHHPRWSSGEHGSQASVAPLYRIMYARGVDVYLAGHDHNYERFRLNAPDGTFDAQRGVRQFVIGTGGKNLDPFDDIAPGSLVRDARHFGILRMRLGARGYAWQFVAPNGAVVDANKSACR